MGLLSYRRAKKLTFLQSGAVIDGATPQVMVPQLPFNAATPLPPGVSGSENEVPQIRGVFLNYDPIQEFIPRNDCK